MKQEVDTVALTLRLPREVSEWLSEVGKPQARSRSSVIRDILYNIYIRTHEVAEKEQQ